MPDLRHAAARADGNAADLSEKINSAHVEAERSLRASVDLAIKAGELLIQAKRTIGHGNWAGWLLENIKFSDRLAQAYMRLARLPIEKRNAVADLPLRDALSAISGRQKKIADQEAREIEFAQAETHNMRGIKRRGFFRFRRARRHSRTATAVTS